MKSKNMDKTIHKNGLIKRELLLLKPFLKEPVREFTLTEECGFCKWITDCKCEIQQIFIAPFIRFAINSLNFIVIHNICYIFQGVSFSSS